MMSTKQKNLKALFGTAAFALMFGSASVHAAGDAPAGTSAQSSGTSAQQTGASAVGSLNKADTGMMKDLAATNMAEIEAARLAMEKSGDDQVKEYAKTMLDDHTRALEKVRDLARVKDVALPEKLDSKHQSELKKLGNLSGDKFDQTYLKRGGVTDHKQAMQLLERIEKRAEDPQLQAMATDLKPTIREHRQMATNMVKNNAATLIAPPGGASSSGSGGSNAASSSGAGMHEKEKSGSK